MSVLLKTRFVDHMSPQADWRFSHKLADAAFGNVRTKLQRVLTGDVDSIDERLEREIFPLLWKVYVRSFELSVEGITRKALRKAAKIPKSAFEATNPFAEAWARKTRVMLKGVSKETKDAIRELTASAFAEGIPPAELARKMRSLIGITKPHMEALLKKRDRWVADGLPKDRVNSLVARQHAKYLKYRTENIARTQTLGASNGGQLDAWRDARGNGELNDDLVKEFIVTPDDKLCDECEPMDGEQVELDEAFSFGGEAPPVHASCRCAVGLVVRS